MTEFSLLIIITTIIIRPTVICWLIPKKVNADLDSWAELLHLDSNASPCLNRKISLWIIGLPLRACLTSHSLFTDHVSVMSKLVVLYQNKLLRWSNEMLFWKLVFDVSDKNKNALIPYAHAVWKTVSVLTYLKHAHIKPLVTHRASAELSSFLCLIVLDWLNRQCLCQNACLYEYPCKVGYVLREQRHLGENQMCVNIVNLCIRS